MNVLDSLSSRPPSFISSSSLSSSSPSSSSSSSSLDSSLVRLRTVGSKPQQEEPLPFPTIDPPTNFSEFDAASDQFLPEPFESIFAPNSFHPESDYGTIETTTKKINSLKFITDDLCPPKAKIKSFSFRNLVAEKEQKNLSELIAEKYVKNLSEYTGEFFVAITTPPKIVKFSKNSDKHLIRIQVGEDCLNKVSMKIGHIYRVILSPPLLQHMLNVDNLNDDMFSYIKSDRERCRIVRTWIGASSTYDKEQMKDDRFFEQATQQAFMGWYFEKGTALWKPHYKSALRWYKLAAKHGNYFASSRLVGFAKLKRLKALEFEALVHAVDCGKIALKQAIATKDSRMIPLLRQHTANLLMLLSEKYQAGIGTPINLTNRLSTLQDAAELGHLLAHRELAKHAARTERDQKSLSTPLSCRRQLFSPPREEVLASIEKMNAESIEKAAESDLFQLDYPFKGISKLTFKGLFDPFSQENFAHLIAQKTKFRLNEYTGEIFIVFAQVLGASQPKEQPKLGELPHNIKIFEPNHLLYQNISLNQSELADPATRFKIQAQAIYRVVFETRQLKFEGNYEDLLDPSLEFIAKVLQENEEPLHQTKRGWLLKHWIAASCNDFFPPKEKAHSQAIVGNGYETGQGIWPIDSEMANRWYEISAENGGFLVLAIKADKLLKLAKKHYSDDPKQNNLARQYYTEAQEEFAKAQVNYKIYLEELETQLRNIENHFNKLSKIPGALSQARKDEVEEVIDQMKRKQLALKSTFLPMLEKLQDNSFAAFSTLYSDAAPSISPTPSPAPSPSPTIKSAFEELVISAEAGEESNEPKAKRRKIG